MTNSKNILVTGGCGFIGSCFVKKQIAKDTTSEPRHEHRSHADQTTPD